MAPRGEPFAVVSVNEKYAKDFDYRFAYFCTRKRLYRIYSSCFLELVLLCI